MPKQKRILFDIKKLEKYYGSKSILSIKNLSIHPGTVYGVHGNIGSGKSTLLEILSGNTKEDSGTLLYDDKEYKKDWLGRVVPEKEVFYKNLDQKKYQKMSVENLINKNLNKNSNIFLKRYFDKNHSKEFLNTKISNITNGEKNWLIMLLAIESDPRAVLIDNYGIYFDSSMERNFRSDILKMNRRLGTTFIISAPSDFYLKQFASVLIRLEKGRISKIRSGISRKIDKKRKPRPRQKNRTRRR